jgi:molecular chaperone GrpE (heat shock protein)
VNELLATFSSESLPTTSPSEGEEAALRQEYQRLQQQLAQQRETLRQEFQQSSLQVLESWLVQWPTAAYAAQQNQQLPAARLLPLVRPVEQLLQEWGVDAIASVGSEIPYDPHLHQLMEGTAQPGELVRVRYTGYCQGDKLLYRAKVSPVGNPQKA